MCLIMTHNAGTTLKRAHLLDILSRNADGFGIMRAEDNALHLVRAVGSVDELLALYYQHAAGRECVLHWRQATHGSVNVDNAHPFRLTERVAVVHNGMLDVATPTRGMSDTWHFCQHVLAPMARDNEDALFHADTVAVLGELIGSSNKLALMHSDGRVALVNESAGVRHAGRWYSNVYAWSAPESLKPRHATRWNWGVRQPAVRQPDWVDELDWGTVNRGKLEHIEPDEPDEPDELVEWPEVDELLAALDREGEAGALDWATANPDSAAMLVADYYHSDYVDALELVELEPVRVAGMLADIGPALRG